MTTAIARPHAPGPRRRQPSAGEDAGLSAVLRDATREAHESAERSPFLERLLGGELGLAAWSELLIQLRPVYAALEDVAETIPGDHPLAALFPRELARTARIDADLAALPKPAAEHLGVTDAATAYAERIRATAGDPARYLAHHYTRYLGDLSGGRIIRVQLGRQYDLDEDAATFFDFPGIDPVPFKRAYRAGVDAWPATAEEIEALTAEARASFAANEAIFAALAARER